MQIIELLKQNKLKVTEDRKAVLNTLEKANQPLSITQIHSQAKKHHPSLNLTTVYRAMDTLEKVGLIQKLNFGDNKYLYEIKDPDFHHHHLICLHCKKITNIEPSSQEGLLKKISQDHNFQVISHNVEVFGLCVDCQVIN